MTKRDRQRFANRARDIILAKGARQTHQHTTAENRTHYEFEYDSKFGPLRISVYPRDTQAGGPGDVMTRFEFPKVAHPATDCNRYSGKWNRHYFDPWTVENALADIERWIALIEPTTLEQFVQATSIVPSAVAETVVAERCHRGNELCDPPYAFACEKGLDHEASKSWFIAHVERRTIFLWDCNPRIARILGSEGDSGRDTLYAFVEHWLDAYQHNQPDYRDKHPLLSSD